MNDKDDGRRERNSLKMQSFLNSSVCCVAKFRWNFNFFFSFSLFIFIFVSCLRSSIENQIIGCYNGLHLSSSVFILPCNSLASILHIYYYYYFLFLFEILIPSSDTTNWHTFGGRSLLSNAVCIFIRKTTENLNSNIFPTMPAIWRGKIQFWVHATHHIAFLMLFVYVHVCALCRAMSPLTKKANKSFLDFPFAWDTKRQEIGTLCVYLPVCVSFTFNKYLLLYY